MDGLAPALRAVPAPRTVRVRVRRAGGADAPPTSWSPSAGPTSTGTDLFEHHACQKRLFDRLRPARRCSTRSRRGSSRPSATRPRSIQLQVEDLRRLRRAPTGGFCQFCFADGHPGVTWSVLDHARVPKVGLRRPAELVPQRAADARAPARAGARRQRDPHRLRRRGRRGRDRRPAPAVHRRPRRRPPSPTSGRSTSTTGPARSRSRSRHPALGTVEHRYDDVLDWLRIVNDR